MGLFEAEMSSNSFQLLGMGETGLLPQVFERRSKYGTPTLGILCSATGVAILSWMSFQEIIEFLNFLYCLGMLLEFAAFVWLRIQQPHLPRPFCIPLSTPGVCALLLPASVFLLVILCLASLKTAVLGAFISMLGFVVYPALEVARQRRWFKFTAIPKSYSKQVEMVDSNHDAHEEGSGLLT
jgi:amino acid transporter